MKSFFRRLSAFTFHPRTFPLFLLALCLAAYAPLLTRLGFYWDDFPMNWIATTMGGAGLARYFSTNRPVWGLVYQVTTPLVGSRPVAWQVFALLLRWATGLSLWTLLRLVWPDREEQRSRGEFAAWAAAAFVIYPGFSQQFISFLYSHFFIILIFFLLSLILMALAIRQEGASRPPAEEMAPQAEPPRKRRFWLLTLGALLLSLLNLLSMEYFFLLDLLRPLLIWTIQGSRIADKRQRMKQTLIAWLPYLLAFAAATYWRSVLFGFQTYQPALMSRLRANPLAALQELVPLVLNDVWKMSALAWAKAFTIPTLLEVGSRNLQRFWLFVAAGVGISAGYLIFYKTGLSSRRLSLSGEPGLVKTWLARYGWAWQPLGMGILALFIAGGPFWLTDLQIGLTFPNDRFSLPFLLGTSLALGGLLVLLPLPRWSKAGLLGIAFGFAIGLQYQYAIVYNRDWSVQRSMFWQMVWRMPDLKPGTLLLSNELPVIHYTDNSLTAPLNWTYDPRNDPAEMKYALLYPTLRKDELLSGLNKDQPVELDYLATTFHGNTSQAIAFYYKPPGCLRVLDSQVDVYNWMVPNYLRESLAIATHAPILAEPQAGKPTPRPPESIYGDEIAHGWCYSFEKADLARQMGEWKTVADIGDEAFSGSDYPNDPLERFPFIEGYAHTGRWERAISLTQETLSFSPVVMKPMLCKLWERIGQNIPAAPEKQKAMDILQAQMNCDLALR